MNPIRTIIAEPQRIILQGVLRELEPATDIEIAGTAATGDEAISVVHAEVPDVAVVAMQLPDISGLTVLEELRDAIPVLFLTSDESPETIFEAMMLGARGYLLKWYADVSLADAIRRVNQGHIVLGAPTLKLFVSAVKDRLNPAQIANSGKRVLSEREREILTLISKGHGQRRIAAMLGVAETTVRTHCRNAYFKLGVKNQAAAVMEASRRGLIDGENLSTEASGTSRSDPHAHQHAR